MRQAWLRRFVAVAAWALAVLLSGTEGTAAETPSLLDTRWDFSDSSLADWRHKDNAEASIAEEGGNLALRLQSRFNPYKFAWVARHFTPRSLAGVVHVRFRVRGDGSGHLLQVHLGAPSPKNVGRSLYYINTRQALRLDFRGWRTVSVDIDQFQTPDGGDRGRDLAQVQFLEFMVHAKDPAVPLDVWLDDIEFVGYSAEELAQLEQQRAERKRLAAELMAALGPVKQSLARLRENLDRAAREGKSVDVARVYWAALDWCARDIERLIEAEELEIVRQAKPFLADLQERLRDPRTVLGRVGEEGVPWAACPPLPPSTGADKLPLAPGDRFDVAKNPYFQSILKSIEPLTKTERAWPKGRAGYRAITDAWAFRRFGDEVFSLVWAMTRPHSPVRHQPMVLANALNLFDLIAHQHTDGDFNVDRTAAYGHDPNINRFCLAPTLDAWWELRRAYPDLLPPSQQAELEAGFKRLVERQVSEYGLARFEARPELRQFPAYPNMDVHYVLILELARRLWNEPRYVAERDAFLKILESAVYPMGAFTYVNSQNECFVYHQLDVVYLARYWQLTGDPKVLELLRKTIPYYPYNVEPAGMPEYYTDACWKHYWGRGDMAGPAVIAALFGDPRNQRVHEITSAVWGYERGHVAAIAAEFFKPVPSQPLPDDYVIYDQNIQGPRGRYGAWSFAANGRNYGVGFQGKDTFVGSMLTDAARRPMPLDAALQVVTAEVRLNHTDNHWLGGRCFSAQEKLTTTVGPDFGSLAVRYTVSRPHWQFKKDDLLPWEGTQTWYLSRTRLVGLVSLEATADDTRAAIHGRIRLGLSRALESAGANAWKHGRLMVKVHGHNYARIVSKPSETRIQDPPARYRSTEITLLDSASVAAGEQGEVRYAKGTRYWFLVEVYPEGQGSGPAEQVERIEQGGLVGFRFRAAGQGVAVLHNPTEQAAEIELALVAPGNSRWTVYEDTKGKGRAVSGGRIRVESHGHVVVTGGPSD